MQIVITQETVKIILGILGCVVLVMLILVLKKVMNVLNNVNKLIEMNEVDITNTIKKAPAIADNVEEVTENAKGVTLVASDVAVDVLNIKDNIKSNLDGVSKVIGIIKNAKK